jgi:uncharacterized protein YndB with AHSA1/START domain
MGNKISVSVPVAASADAVFAAATDWPGQREWIFATNTVATRGDGKATGDEISARTGYGPFGFTDTMTITEWDPPRLCSVLHTGKVVKGTATFAVEADGPSASRFIWSEVVEAPFGRVGALGFRAIQGVFVFFLRLSLKRFVRWAEVR